MNISEVIDLEAYTKSEKKVPVGKKYRIKVDSDLIVVDTHVVTGKQILIAANKIPVECFSLYQKFRNKDFEKIGLDEEVDLTTPGIEKFVTKEPEVFYYTVDDEPETTDSKELTPNQILMLAGIKPVKDYYLVQINHDGSQTSYKDSPDTPIQMQCPSMKFISIFRGEMPVS